MRSVVRFGSVALLSVVFALPLTARAKSLCSGKKPGTITFYDREISRDKRLPKAVTKLDFSKPMFALLCLTNRAGPQDEGGDKFRVVLYVRQTNLKKGQYSSYKEAKQTGAIFRPQLSASRKAVIVSLGEDFGDELGALLDAGQYEFRLQAASEKGTGKLDVTVDWNNSVAYLQELRKAGYLADGKVTVSKKQ